MKLTLGMRGKLLLLIGAPFMFFLAASIYLGFSRNSLEADYDRIQVGMTSKEVLTIIEEMKLRRGAVVNMSHFDPAQEKPAQLIFSERSSSLVPYSRIRVIFSNRTEQALIKEIHRPTMDEHWDNCKYLLGL